MNWQQAKTRELYVIAFDDPYAQPVDVYHAKTEINRRKEQKKYARLKQTEKNHYGK